MIHPLKQTYISQTISIYTFLQSARLRDQNGILTETFRLCIPTRYKNQKFKLKKKK